MRPVRVLALTTLALLAACSREQANGSPPPAPSASAPEAAPAPADTTHEYPDSTEASAILKRLKTLAPTGGSGFDTAYAPRIDPGAVLAFVSDSGLVMSDVNDDSGSVRLSRPEIASQLTARRGRAFVTLVHLAHIYSQPYPQYSQLAFSRRPGELEVAVASWYLLGFTREHGHMRLRRVDYTEFEGE